MDYVLVYLHWTQHKREKLDQTIRRDRSATAVELLSIQLNERDNVIVDRSQLSKSKQMNIIDSNLLHYTILLISKKYMNATLVYGVQIRLFDINKESLHREKRILSILI